MANSSVHSVIFDAPDLERHAAPLPGIRSPWAVLLLLVAVAPIWLSLGDHSFYGRSDGRYAVVSMEMADHGDWLVPHWMGKPHLTKPPLTYWMEAALLKVVGHGEWAVRIPGAMAGSLTLILLFAAGGRLLGGRGGWLAVGLLSLTPLHVCVSRLPLTDAPMTLFWFGTLLGGAMAVREPLLRRWPVLLWTSVALGLLTKGPVAWIPVGVLILWLALARDWAKLKCLRLLGGFLISLAPLLAWVGIVVWQRPDAIALWRHEMIDRMTGDGAHREPIWYFIPIFLGGLFPMTALIPWPLSKQAWSKARAMVRRADETSLWALAVIVPFIFFSLGVGKLATYLMPLGAPLALLVAGAILPHLNRSGIEDKRESSTTIHWTLHTCAVGAALAATIAFLWLRDAVFLWLVVPCLLMALASGFMARSWRQAPAARPRHLCIVWICALLVWIGAGELENWFLEPGSDAGLIAQVSRRADLSQVRFATYGKQDNDFAFYTRQPVTNLNSLDDLSHQLQERQSKLAVVTTLDAWQQMQTSRPDVAGQFTEIAVQPKHALGKPYRILLLTR